MQRPWIFRRRGFTLIELVVVLLIIATLAGLAIPVVSMLGRSADMAASAKTQADLANNIQMFFVLQKRYPQGLDSLITTTGSIYSADTTNASTQTIGLPYSGAYGTRLQDQLQTWAIDNSDDSSGNGTGGSFKSVSRSGFDWVYNHDTSVKDSNNSGTVQVPLSSGMTVAEVKPTGPLALALVPQGLQAGQRLIALGIGPKNSAIGKTITNCPIYPGCEGKYYGRYVAVFMVYATGERATLVGVIDSYGRYPDYTQQQFNQSLPDGGRQG
jgi:prepilin-type N-terminal cleavage/methylation domain-containing protein